MGLFSAIVKVGVDIVKLPVSAPLAVAKDALDIMGGYSPTHVEDLVEEIKEDSEG